MTAWTLAERKFVAELTVRIAERLFCILREPYQNDRNSDFISHMFSSDFENGCDTLWKLGVASGFIGDEQGLFITDAEDKSRFFAAYRFLPEVEIREAILETETSEHYPSIEEIVRAYISLTAEYGSHGSALCSSRESFHPQDEYAREIEVLVEHGYMARLGNNVIWTDKIAPHMEAAYIWERDD